MRGRTVPETRGNLWLGKESEQIGRGRGAVHSQSAHNFHAAPRTRPSPGSLVLPDSQKIHGRMQNGSEHDAKKKKTTPHFTRIKSQTRSGVWGKTDTQTYTDSKNRVFLKKKIINPGGRSRDETSPYRTGARFE